MSLNDILSRFTGLNCSNDAHQPHILKLHFPVGSLLPDGCHLYMEPPKDVIHRCEPPEDRRISGLLDLDFPVVLMPNTATPTSGTAPHQVLLDAIIDLPRLGGSSVLGIALYFDEITDQVIYLYRLTTTTSSGFSSCRYYKLDANESCLLLSLGITHEWISLLQHLVSRSSEHAYYHVRKQLTDQYGIACAFEEERKWETSWSESQCFSLKEALRDRMRSIFPESAAGGRDVLRLMLPCGHVLETSTTKLSRMSETECRELYCPHCHVPVLQTDNIHGVEVAIESSRCTKKHHRNKHWAILNHVPDGHARQFNGKSLAAATRAALGSFVVSPLSSPPTLCSAGSAYTENVMQHFESFFSDGDIKINEKPERLVEMLIQDALESAVGEDGESLSKAFVPPAYIKFLYAWFCRAVNFLCDRQCDEMKANHLGVHRHGRQLMYNLAVWESNDGGERALVESDGDDEDMEAAMDSLNTEMVGVDLRGAAFSMQGMLDSMDIETAQEDPELEEEL